MLEEGPSKVGWLYEHEQCVSVCALLMNILTDGLDPISLWASCVVQ